MGLSHFALFKFQSKQRIWKFLKRRVCWEHKIFHSDHDLKKLRSVDIETDELGYRDLSILKDIDKRILKIFDK